MWDFSTLFIDGKDQSAESGATLDVISPANGDFVGRSGLASQADANRAVAATKVAFETGPWPAMSGAQRGVLLSKLADLVARDAQELGAMDAQAIGRPTVETQILDLPNAIATFRYYAGWCDKLEGRVVPTAGYFDRPNHSFVT